jgi:hypothetical protein
MWQVVCSTGLNGGVMAALPNEKLIRAAFAHACRDRKTQSYEFQLKDPYGHIVQTGHSNIMQGKGKK